MTVDLNRLREARESEYWDVEVLYALGEAALSAPTVWWCDCTPPYGLTRGHGLARTPEDCLEGDECGWVALVPVKGGPDAS